MSFNKVFLIGRITKSVELKTTQSNIPVVAFTLAVDKQFKDDEKQADFFTIVAWRKLAELIVQYCDKGSLIAVDGKLSTRQYDTENGTRYVVEVVADNVEFLTPKKKEEKQEEVKSGKYSSEQMYEASKQLAAEEDLPF
jgi:single-strand DNA-binding protein